MSDPSHPDLPPDLPPEYAEAYRRGFERAYRAASGEQDVDAQAAARAEAEAEVERTQRLDLEGLDELLAAAPRREYVAPTHRAPDDDERERPAWLVPGLLAGLVVILLAGAYLTGLLFSSSVDDADVTPPEPDGVVLSEDGESPPPTEEASDASGKKTKEPAGEKAYAGPVEIADVGGATASCESPSSVDAAGNRVGYEPANTFDGDLSTAWRCDGDGAGESLTLSLAESVEIGEVGLVPGYAKTDPRSGDDRYAENNRLTRVRWVFSDGTALVQRLDGSETNRDLQTLRIPLTSADSVTIEVLASTPGPRNTIAVSEVRIGSAAG